MNKSTLKNIFQNYQAAPLKQREYAIMIPLLEIKGEPHLLFEVRAKHLHTQPGEISFPGGRVELNETKQQAAVRETCEELSLSPTSLEVWGYLGALPPSFNRCIHFYIGSIETSLKCIHPNQKEVAEIFTVPLAFFLQHQPKQYEVDLCSQPPDNFPYHLIPNGKSYRWPGIKYPVPFHQYQQRVIWGLTARGIERFVYILNSNYQLF